MPVGEKDVLPATDAAPEDLDDPELHDPDAEPGWMYTILNLPLIGEKIGGFLAIAPLVLILILFGETGDTPGTSSDLLIFGLAIPLSYVWLIVLERIGGVILCLPVPFVSIPIKWALIVFGVGFGLDGAGLLG